jgi:hypothetical protein
LDADPTTSLAVGDDVMVGDTPQPNFRVVSFGAAGSHEISLEPINAQYVERLQQELFVRGCGGSPM